MTNPAFEGLSSYTTARDTTQAKQVRQSIRTLRVVRMD
jgi:hypothetical protein